MVHGLWEVLERQRFPLIIDLDGMGVEHPETSNERMWLAMRMIKVRIDAHRVARGFLMDHHL